MNKKLLIQLIIVFLITQIIGLYVANALIGMQVQASLVSEDINDVMNSIALIAYILTVTAVMLIVIKFLKKKAKSLFLKLFETLAIFGTSWIVFEVFFSEPLGLILAMILTTARIAFPKKLYLRNACAIMAIIGAGAVIGISLGVIPALVLVIALSIYDFIAVFKTKHMVTLAKEITKKNLAFTIAMPTKEHKFELGTGDLVIPLVFASSILQASNWKIALIALIASLIGLLITIDYSSKHVGKALPALPLQGILMTLAYAASIIIRI